MGFWRAVPLHPAALTLRILEAGGRRPDGRGLGGDGGMDTCPPAGWRNVPDTEICHRPANGPAAQNLACNLSAADVVKHITLCNEI